MQVATQEDGYIIERFEQYPRWIAHLSNGEKVYEDDGRPNVEPYSAWLRLKNYVHNNNLSIVSLIIQFRSHVVQVNHEPVDGFFFRKKVLGSFGDDNNTHFYVVGTLKNGTVWVTSYQVPEIEVEIKETRDPKDCLDGLILNYGTKI